MFDPSPVQFATCCHVCQDNEVIVVARRHRRETKMSNGIFDGPEGPQDWKREFPPSKMVELTPQKWDMFKQIWKHSTGVWTKTKDWIKRNWGFCSAKKWRFTSRRTEMSSNGAKSLAPLGCKRCPQVSIYPLVNIQQTMENHGTSPFWMGKSTINGPCSIAMLNDRRVGDRWWS